MTPQPPPGGGATPPSGAFPYRPSSTTVPKPPTAPPMPPMGPPPSRPPASAVGTVTPPPATWGPPAGVASTAPPATAPPFPPPDNAYAPPQGAYVAPGAATPWGAPPQPPQPPHSAMPGLPPGGSSGRILMEEQVDPNDKTKFVLLVVGFLLFILIAGSFAIIGAISSYKKTKPKEGEVGLLGLALYGQTRARLTILAMLNGRYYEQNGQWATDYDQLIRLGADPGLFQDKWGTKIRMDGPNLVTNGADLKPNTKDDMWVDCRTMEVGGFMPEQNLSPEAMGMLPPEARTMLKAMTDAQSHADEIMRRRSEFMTQMESGDNSWMEQFEEASSSSADYDLDSSSDWSTDSDLGNNYVDDSGDDHPRESEISDP